jgi:hypothetical protein
MSVLGDGMKVEGVRLRVGVVRAVVAVSENMTHAGQSSRGSGVDGEYSTLEKRLAYESSIKLEGWLRLLL